MALILLSIVHDKEHYHAEGAVLDFPLPYLPGQALAALWPHHTPLVTEINAGKAY